MEHYKTQFLLIQTGLEKSKNTSEIYSVLSVFKHQLNCYLNFCQGTDISSVKELYEDNPSFSERCSKKIKAHYKLESVNFDASLSDLHSYLLGTPRSRRDQIWKMLFGQITIKTEIYRLLIDIFDFLRRLFLQKMQ